MQAHTPEAKAKEIKKDSTEPSKDDSLPCVTNEPIHEPDSSSISMIESQGRKSLVELVKFIKLLS